VPNLFLLLVAGTVELAVPAAVASKVSSTNRFTCVYKYVWLYVQ